MDNRTWTGLQNDIAKFFQRPQPPQQMDGSSDTSVFLASQKTKHYFHIPIAAQTILLIMFAEFRNCELNSGQKKLLTVDFSRFKELKMASLKDDRNVSAEFLWQMLDKLGSQLIFCPELCSHA